MSLSPQSSVSARRAVGAAVVGNVLEWYDFAVYGYLAGSIGRAFFPTGDAATELLASFGVFGVGFLARPLGGIVLGRIGDVMGRRTALLMTLFLMATGTVLMGLAPTYAMVGVFAPVVVVIARLLQGFSAGGEWGGSTAFIVEWAPEGRRGFFGSLQQCSVAGGLLLGSGIAALLSTVLDPATMDAWGWRVPFLFGGVLGPIGLWMRRTIEETPAYVRATGAVPTETGMDTDGSVVQTAHDPMSKPAESSQAMARSALGNRSHEDAARHSVDARSLPRSRLEPRASVPDHPFNLAARAFGFTVLWTVSYYIFLNYMPTFTARYANLGGAQALWSNTIGLLVLVIVIPLWGGVSDRVGRRPLLLACCAAFVLLPYPVASYLVSGPPFAAIVALQVVLAIILAMFSGAGPAAIAEIFPTRSRSTWMTTGYAIAVAIFGGFAPYVATWLIRETGSPIAWVWYVMAAALISGAVIIRLDETAHQPLR